MSGVGPEGDGTFMTEPQLNYEELVEEEEHDLEILISGVTETTQSTLLLKKKKEMREVDEALDFMKAEFKKRMDMCDERESKFNAKQAEMKAMVLRFQQFIQDNDSKRGRAEAKTQADAAASVKLEKEIKANKAQLEAIQKEKADIEKRLASLERYVVYLDGIVSGSEGEYDEIDMILRRYKTLEDANKDLHRQSGDISVKTEKLRQALAGFVRDKQLESLMLSSETQQAAKKIEGLSAEAAALDVTSEQSDVIARQKRQQVGTVVSSVQSLYTRCWSQMGGTKVPTAVAAAAGAGKDKVSFDYLKLCLETIGQRAETLQDIKEGFPAYLEGKARDAKAKAAAAAASAAPPQKQDVGKSTLSGGQSGSVGMQSSVASSSA